MALKLVHVASSYPRHEGDVTAPFMEEMLHSLTVQGHDVSIVVPNTSGLTVGVRNGVRVVSARYAPQFAETWGYGLSLNPAGRLRASAMAQTPMALFSMIRAVRREIRELNPDLIHLHWLLPQGVIALAAPDGVPIVISVHGADIKYIDGTLEPLARRIIRRADAIVGASSAILERVEAIFPDAGAKSRVIPHGADSRLFSRADRLGARRRLQLSAKTKVLLGVGRLVRKKGFALLIEAMDRVPEQSAQLVLIGDGPERKNLESAGRASQKDVRLLGRASRQDVAQWMAAADVVVVPSIDADGDLDSGPVVLVEALAAGTCVVATRVGMAPDIIVDGVNGYLSETSNPDELAGLISKALEQSEQLGLGASSTFERIGDWARVAEDLEKVYETAIGSRSARTS